MKGQMAFPGKMEDLPIKWRKFMSKKFDFNAHPITNKQFIMYHKTQHLPVVHYVQYR